MAKDADRQLLIIDNFYVIRIRCECGGHMEHKVHQHLRDGVGVIARCDTCNHEIVITREP